MRSYTNEKLTLLTTRKMKHRLRFIFVYINIINYRQSFVKRYDYCSMNIRKSFYSTHTLITHVSTNSQNLYLLQLLTVLHDEGFDLNDCVLTAFGDESTSKIRRLHLRHSTVTDLGLKAVLKVIFYFLSMPY